MRQTINIMTIFVLLMSLAACSANIEKEQASAIVAVEKILSGEKAVEANNETDDIKYYLPKGSKVKSSTSNNLIFEKGSNTYILFFNENEDDSSEVVYKASLGDDVDYIIHETYKENNAFGFFLADEIEEDVIVTTVGIGGIKVTTETDVKHLVSDAEMMMQVATSLEYIK